MNDKKPWASKTMWLNVLAGVALLVQNFTGFVIDPQAQGAILIIANLILRAVTKGAVVLS